MSLASGRASTGESAAAILRSAESVLGAAGKSAVSAGGGNATANRSLVNASMLESTVANLTKVSANKKTAKRLARNKDAIQGLLKTMNDSPKFCKMIEYSVTCLKNMAVDAVCVEELIDEGVLETLLKIQRLNPYNESLNRMINEALAAFCLNDDLARLIAERMGAGQFVFSLRKHVEPETVAATCGAMSKLMRIDPNVDMFVAAECIAGLDHVCQTMQDEPEVMAAVAACVACIARNPAHVAALMATQIVPGILHALRQHPDNKNLVASTLLLLANIAAAHNGHYVEYLRGLGCVDLIVAALEANANNKAILKVGADALRRIATAADLMSALRVSAAVTDETLAALAKLSSLLLVDDNVALVVQQKGIEWLIAVLKMADAAPPSQISYKILRSGCRALMRVCVDENRIFAVMQCNGVNVLHAIVDHHGKDAEICVNALRALARMVTRKENVMFLLQCGIMGAAAQAVATHPADRDVAEAVADTWERLARTREAHPTLLSAGIIPAIMSMLRAFRADPPIVEKLARALAHLAVSPEAVQAMLDAGLAQLIAELLKEHADNGDIARALFALLDGLARNAADGQGPALLRAAGVTEAVLGVLEKQKGDSELQALGSDLMGLIAGATQLKDAVGHVWATAQAMLKQPASAAAYAGRMVEVTSLLGALALVDANLEPLSSANAPAALVAAMQAAMLLPANSDERARILADAAHGLTRLLGPAGEPHAIATVQSNVFSPLLSAIMADPSDEQLAEDSVACIATCAHYPSNVAALVKAGTVPAVIAVSKLFPMNEAIQAAAAAVLGAVFQDPTAVGQLVTGGGAGVVVESLLTNIDDADRLVENLAVLRRLAQDPAACEALYKAGALDAVLAVLRKHPQHAGVVLECVHALSALLVSEAIALEVGEKKALPLLLEAVRAHYKHPGLGEADFILLDSLSTAEPNAVLLLEPELNAIDLLNWAVGLKRFKAEPATVAAAQSLLERLCTLRDAQRQEALRNDVANFSLDDESAGQFLDSIVRARSTPDALTALFEKFEMMMANPEVVRLMAKNGGLQAMAAVMNANADKEDIFARANNCFQRFCGDFDDGDVLAQLEQEPVLAAQCEVVKPHATWRAPIADDKLLKGLMGLGSIKIGKPAASAMTGNGTVQALTKIITTHHNADVIAAAAKVLGKVSNDEDAADAIARMGFGSIRELIDALRKNLQNVEFLRCGVFLLSNLAYNDALKDQIGVESGVHLVIQIMRAHETHAALVQTCMYALATLTFGSAVNCAFVLACKGIPLVVSFMNNNLTNADILDSSICILSNLCQDNDSNKHVVVADGGAQAVVDTVLNNFDSVDVLVTAFRALSVFAFNATTVDAIIRAGGVQGVVASMTTLADNVDVVDGAIRALTKLCSNCTAEHMQTMAHEGAVQAILEVLAQHASNVEIAYSCVTALCNLSVLHDNADLIIKQGGVETVLSALATLGYDAEFVEMAIRLLFNLTYSINNLNRIIDAGVTRKLIAALQGQMQSVPVLSIGLRTIANLCYSDDVCTRIANEGPIEFALKLMGAMLQAGNATPVVRECLTALSALCRSEPNALAMAAHSLQLSTTALQRGLGDTPLLQAVSQFLANLFVHAPASVAATETHVVPAALGVVSAHVQNAEVLLSVTKPLENMAYANQSVRDYMKAQGTIPKMEEVIAANADREDVRNAAQAVINSVNRVDYAGAGMDFVNFDRARKNLKDVYAAMGEDKKDAPDQIAEVPPKIRNFLTAGALLTKHSRTAAPRARHVYMSDDMKWLIWKDPKAKAVDEDTRMKIFKIRSVERGRCTEQLQRQRFGKFLANDKCAFSIQGRERTVDLEAPTEKDRERWVEAIEVLIAYRKNLQALQHRAAQF